MANLEERINPPSRTSEHRRAVTEAIRRGLLVSRGFSNLSERDREAFAAEWIDTLEVYHVDQIKAAWQAYYRSDASFPDLKVIVGFIEAERGKLGVQLAAHRREQERRLEALATADRERERVKPETVSAALRSVEDVLRKRGE